MQTRPTRTAAFAILTFLASLVLSVAAATAASAASDVCAKPEPRKDDTIHIQGCLSDTREKPAKAVPEVNISVEDESGAEVGTAVTNENGVFDVALPGKAFDVLGKTFTVKIDTESLPDGTELTNPDQKSLDVKIQLMSDRFVTFPIGDKATAGSKLVEAGQLMIGGLVFALLLAMASLGLSMIFGTTGLTNFSHGELITFGALAAFTIDQLPGDIRVGGTNVTMVAAIIFATIASVIFGWVQEKALWAPLRRRGTGLIAAMIVSIGFSIFLRNVYQYFFGGNSRNYSQWTSPSPYQFGPFSITPKEIGVIVFATLVLVLVSLAVQKTRIGKATRAVADNTALSASTGINVDRVIAVVWAVGAGLAGLSGVLLGMTQGFDYQIGFKILLLVFAAVVLGGLGSIWGALVGSLIIGLFVEVSTVFIPAELKFVGALVVLIVVLMFRPQGLLGRAERIG